MSFLNKVRIRAKKADSFLLWSMAVALVALLLRLFHITLLEYSPTGDQQVYPSYGDMFLQWITAGGLSDYDKWLLSRNPPGFSFLVGLIRHIFGYESLKIVYVLQAFADSATVILFFFLGRLLFSSVVGFLSAFIYGFYSIAIIYTAQMQTETCTVFLTVLSLYLSVKALSDRRWWLFALAGVVAGITALFRLNTLTVPVAGGLAGLYYLYKSPGKSQKLLWFAHLSIYTVATLLTVLPTSILNSRHAGQPVLVAGSNGERLMLGANYNSRGEWVGRQPIPPEWREAMDAVPVKEQDKVARSIVKDFMFNTHAAYYWFTIVPNKFWQLLWADHWVYVGQHRGNTMEYPFGPYLRIPLFTSGFIVFLGLMGLFYSSRVVPRILLLNVILQLWSIQALIIEARYRLLAEAMLLVPCAAIVYNVFFRDNTIRRLQKALYLFVGFSIAWSFLNVLRFGGPNLALASIGQHPILREMTTSEYVLKKEDMTPVTIDIGGFPVDAGHCSHLALSFDYKLERPAGKENDYNTYSTAWPKISMTYSQFNDTMTTITEYYSMQNAPELSAFQTNGGEQWRIVELHGYTKYVKLHLTVENAGTIQISDLTARGPVWCQPK